ncbi:GIY-YIG nuclease family protein [Altericista sp. CCNU0014]|uniref:GIY-YIG nuclease family protein n=1 Tax=Altericista sp. CCNU0014 TaxID=3082949 RepID=UPI00384DBBDD
MNTDPSTSIEHQNVPQAHRGLHDFLYSSDDEHSISVPEAPNLEINSESVVDLETWCAETAEAKVAGVYAVLDRDRQTQYIGYSRNVTLSLKSHLTQHGADTCAFVKVQPFKFPKREEIEQLRDAWIAELPQTPPGNADTNGTWAGTVKDAASQTMSPAEREAYEAKKLKLRRAMADGSLHQEASQAQTDAERQQALEAAVEGDNWSAVIREQTQDTQAI